MRWRFIRFGSNGALERAGDVVDAVSRAAANCSGTSSIGKRPTPIIGIVCTSDRPSTNLSTARCGTTRSSVPIIIVIARDAQASHRSDERRRLRGGGTQYTATLANQVDMDGSGTYSAPVVASRYRAVSLTSVLLGPRRRRMPATVTRKGGRMLSGLTRSRCSMRSQTDSTAMKAPRP